MNAKSVTVPAKLNDGYVVTRANARLDWTDTIPYHKVSGSRTAADMAAILAEADRAAAAEVTGRAEQRRLLTVQV